LSLLSLLPLLSPLPDPPGGRTRLAMEIEMERR
jgi:hypothetical protein